ncbi:MAG: glycosyltransferase family 2 protein [Ignavibacteria bacterium]|nr:MAG: glycosyltransferase family 2 protein [Ignavibacteria bacterium]
MIEIMGIIFSISYAIFWTSLFLLVYHYLGYPLLLFVLGKFKKGKINYEYSSDCLPKVTLVISAYNEANVIENKLQNSLNLDYPAQKLEILVVSDSSTDGTDEIVQKWMEKDPRIRLLRLPRRSGKSIGLNNAVSEARGEIIVFSDANALYEQNAIKELVKYFADKQVGFVVGSALYYEDKENLAVQSEGMYWKYETFLKELESDFYSVCVGDGAIYAVRRELYQNLEADDIGDFANPLIIAAKGYRGVFNRNAVCYEEAAGDFAKEFSRKRRIVNRSFRSFRKYVRLFDWSKQYKFIFELFSHKILRWFNWFLLLLLFFSNIVLVSNASMFYTMTLIFQLILGALTLLGALLIQKTRNLPFWVSLPFYFFSSHFAAFMGIVDELRGEKYVTWEHVREANSASN